MAGIQQSINQGMSIAAFLVSQTDVAKNLQQKRALTKEYQAQTKLIDAIEKEVTTPNKDGKGRSYKQTPITEMEEVLNAERERRATAEKLFKLKGNVDEILLDETGGGIEYMKELIQERKKEEAQQTEATEATAQAEAEERQISEQSAAASNVIQSAIKDPFSIADAELQKAIQTKQEINRRKGGIML